MFLKTVNDGAGIRDGPGQAVQFRDDQCVVFAHSCESLVQVGSGTVGARQAVVGADAVLGDTQV